MPVKTTKPAPKAPAKTKSAAKPAIKAPAKSAAKAIAKTGTKVSDKAADKSAAKKPVPKPAAKPDAKTAKTPLQKAALKPAAKAAAVKKPATKKPVAAKVATKTAKVIDPIEQLARAIAKTLDTNKAEQIVTIPLAGRSSLADWMVIASGKSARQVGALANYAQRALAEAGVKRVRVEGLPQGDWVVIDSGDVVIHIFRPEVRDYYQLERLWAEDEGEPAQVRTLR